jgi:YidC/Oxa1 family membrane protein insertase
MNDIRRTILWVIFGISMVMLWDHWQVHNGKKATFFPSPAQQAVSVPGAAPANSVNPSSGALVSAGGTSQQAPILSETAEAPSERIVVTTDVLKLTFDTKGGSLVGSELLKQVDLADHSKNVVLLEDNKDHTYTAQSGLLSLTGDRVFPSHTAPMTMSGERDLKDGEKDLVVTFTSQDLGDVKLVKTYTIRRGAYDIAVKHAVTNTGATAVSPDLYVQLVRDGHIPVSKTPPPKLLQLFGVKTTPSFSSTFTGAAVYTESKKYQNFDFPKIKKMKGTDPAKTGDYEQNSTSGFVAMVQHYFVSAWILPDGIARKNTLEAFDRDGVQVPDCCYRASMRVAMDPIAPGATKTVDATLFVGPQEEKVLEALSPGLELVKDYGWLRTLAKPLYWLLDELHSLIGNWGWSIMALVLLIKIAFYWLSAKAYASTAKMKAVNPKITEMRARLKDNPQQMQQEMMRIYREEKVNPMGGCFPILIQIPVFIALYNVLLSTVEMRNAPWAFWITDLSSLDPYFILPLIMTATTLLQTALNPTPPDPMQAKMMWFMPLIFSVMFFFFPAGLVLYWITNNSLSIAQQWIINTRMGVPPQFNLPWTKK